MSEETKTRRKENKMLIRLENGTFAVLDNASITTGVSRNRLIEMCIKKYLPVLEKYLTKWSE